MKINENIFSLLGFECQSYKVLDQRDRAMSFSGLSEEKCDGKDPDDISPIAWYRMMGETGDQIPEKCIPINRCGTRAPGWLNGKHPTVDEGIVNRKFVIIGTATAVIGKTTSRSETAVITLCISYRSHRLAHCVTVATVGQRYLWIPLQRPLINKLFSLLNQSMSHFT